MKTIILKTQKNTSTQLLIGSNISSILKKTIEDLKPSKVVFVTERKLVPLLLKYTNNTNVKNIYALPSGESTKSLNNLSKILDFFFKTNLDKKSPVIAFGGGVVTDITGFAASIYMRGLPYITVPTTVLGMVDAAIGGKNTINYGDVKNVLGTIYQPKAVVIDVELMNKLPKRHVNTGYAEIIKYAIGFDLELLKMLETQRDIRNTTFLLKIIETSVRIKTKIVSSDPDESKGNRKLLNLGHTLGHALEGDVSLHLTHGEAISIGMCFAAYVSMEKRLIEKIDLDRICKLFDKFNLPKYIEFNSDEMIERMMHDKKKTGNEIDYILMNKIGTVLIYKMTIQELRKYLISFKTYNSV